MRIGDLVLFYSPSRLDTIRVYNEDAVQVLGIIVQKEKQLKKGLHTTEYVVLWLDEEVKYRYSPTQAGYYRDNFLEFTNTKDEL